MTNPWTAQNQADYDKTEQDDRAISEMEDKSTIESAKFGIKEIILAFGVTSNNITWKNFSSLTDYVENFAIGGVVNFREDHLIDILEALEGEDLIDVNWESKIYQTNF